MERGEHLGIVDVVGNTQRAQHRGQLAVGAEGQHMNRARADLRPLERLGGEAAAGMRQPLDDGHALAAPQELGGGKQPAQPRANHYHIIVA